MSPTDLWGIIDKAGTVGCLILMVVAFSRGWVFTANYVASLKEQIKEIRNDRDEWRRAALWGTDVAKRLTDTAAPLLGHTRRDP